jgi:alkanesulfonate monooxygenase SsuD/methylene tetrahydromethanopterin reductase-like flavin-dependent oxidoreductase (luciferase family)
MTILAGTICGQLKTSHLYAVFKGPYVYFGETGNVPPVRWKGHLTSEADFIGKLKKVDIAAAFDDEPIFFVGIHISVADAEPEAKRKVARRAIEAELHQRFSLDPARVTPAINLLSSSPPVPARHQFGFDKVSVATAVYAMIADEYQKWLMR